MRTTNRFRALLSLVTAGMLGGLMGAFAGTTSDDYAESFEGYADGASVTSIVSTAWQASEPDASVFVSTNYFADYVGNQFPIDYNHATSKVLHIMNGVTNTVDAGIQTQTTWVDMVLKPVLMDSDPGAQDGAVVGCYFNASSNLVLLHAVDPINSTTLGWLEIPDVTVDPNKWIRLTIAANMVNGDQFAGDITRFYQFYLNGIAVSNAAAFQSPSTISGSGGTWFASGAPVERTDPITNLVIKGTGYLDDLVFTNSLEFAEPAGPSFIQTFPSVGQLTYGQTLGDASLTGGTAINTNDEVIAGDFMFVDPSIVPMVGTSDYDLSFTPSNRVAYLSTTGLVSVVTVHAPSYIATVEVSNQLTSGQMLSAAGVYGTATNAAGTILPGQFAFVDPNWVPSTGTTSFAVSFTPDDTGYLTATGSVAVVTISALTTTAIGTPTTWYDDLGITLGTNTYDDLDILDTDGDGVLNWQEYVAGTHPTNGASVFMFLGLDFNGTNATLQWIGGTNGPSSSYVIESTTNLTPPIIWEDMLNAEPRAEGTNEWEDAGAPALRWYRIRATGN